ncbi:hypothetical protein PLCT2_00892 [Planctomycetaceae bacterium]|nr:hypothetical protein PLCT2_00892 [Planctomycetaceae bacterium]
MPETVQNYANHRRIVPGFHVGVFGALVVNALWSFVAVGLSLSGGIWAIIAACVYVILALALLGLFLYGRLFALTVQDRVIRLEMRLRLQQVLPDDLKSRVHDLSRDQLVALRFASDAEMPELVRSVLSEAITDREEIKKRIKEWQPDHLRV